VLTELSFLGIKRSILELLEFGPEQPELEGGRGV